MRLSKLNLCLTADAAASKYEYNVVWRVLMMPTMAMRCCYTIVGAVGKSSRFQNWRKFSNGHDLAVTF